MKREKLLIFLLTSFVFFFFVENQIFAATVIVNEFLVDPDINQWVELYNKGEESIDISGWFIDDSGGTEKFTVPLNTIIATKGFKVFESGRFNLNRTSPDTINLINGSVIEDSYSYGIGPGINKSYGREIDGGDNWVIFDSPTKGTSNNTSKALSIITPTLTFKPTPTQKPTPTLKPTHTPKPTPTIKSTSINKKTIINNEESISLAKNITEAKTDDQQGDNFSDGDEINSLDNATESSSILGDKVIRSSGANTVSSVNKISPTSIVKTRGSFKSNLSKIFIAFGVTFLIVCSILIFRSYRRLKRTKIDSQI